MKNQKLFVFMLLVIFIFGFLACSKSSKAGESSGSAGNNSSVSGGDSGLIITIKSIPAQYNGRSLTLILRDNENSDDLAGASGEIENGTANMYLTDAKNGDAWKKTGKYYISLISFDGYLGTFTEYNLTRSGNTVDYRIVSSDNSNLAESSFIGKGEGWIPLSIWKEYGFTSGVSKPQGVKVDSAKEEASVEEIKEHTEINGKMASVVYAGYSRRLYVHLINTDESSWLAIRNNILSNSLSGWSEDENRLEDRSGQKFGNFKGKYILDGLTYHINCSFSSNSRSVILDISTGKLSGTEIALMWPSNDFFNKFGLSGIMQPEDSKIMTKYASFVQDYFDYSSYKIDMSWGNEAGYNNLKNQISQKLKVTPYEDPGNSETPASTVFEKEDIKVIIFHNYFPFYKETRPVGLEIQW